jgi:hypothetical protein
VTLDAPSKSRSISLDTAWTTMTAAMEGGRHLVSAAQASAISYGKNIKIYEEALELLHA